MVKDLLSPNSRDGNVDWFIEDHGFTTLTHCALVTQLARRIYLRATGVQTVAGSLAALGHLL